MVRQSIDWCAYATSGAPFAIALNGRIAVSPDGNRVYAPTGTGLATYSIGTDGILAAVDSRSDSPGAGAAAAVTPDGRFVYLASGPGQSRISTFSVSSATGALSPLAEHAGTVRHHVPRRRGKAISPNGQFLFLSSLSTLGRIEAYTIASSTGGSRRQWLTLCLARFAEGTRARSERQIPVRCNRFWSGRVRGGCGERRVDGGSGQSLRLFEMVHVAVDASGHYLYATYLSSPIAAYTIDQATGALSSIAGGPFGPVREISRFPVARCQKIVSLLIFLSHVWPALPAAISRLDRIPEDLRTTLGARQRLAFPYFSSPSSSETAYFDFSWSSVNGFLGLSRSTPRMGCPTLRPS